MPKRKAHRMANKNDLSEVLAAAVEKCGPSVLRVEARSRTPSTGLVWSADGLVVTAHHTLQRDEQIQVGLPEGKLVSGTVIGRDPSTDVAVLFPVGPPPLERAQCGVARVVVG